MKVILLADVKNYGKKGDVVEAADGYARNYLIPRGLAVDVNKQTLKKLEEQKADQKQLAKQKHKEALALKDELKEIVLTIPVKTGEEGKVFGSVSTKQIIDELEKNYNIKLDKRKMKTEAPLNTLGMNFVEVELDKDVIGVVSVRLVEKN